MSTAPDQPSIWTPEFISCIVYRVVMIIVSIAFIWKKYRRPARQIDEEQVVGVILPSYTNPARRVRSANEPSQPRLTNSLPRRPMRPPTLREVISAHLDDIIQSALGIDDNGIDINVLRTSSASPQSESPRAIAAGSSLDKVGLDIELGDVGLRHRSADSDSESKNGLRHSELKGKA